MTLIISKFCCNSVLPRNITDFWVFYYFSLPVVQKIMNWRTILFIQNDRIINTKIISFGLIDKICFSWKYGINNWWSVKQPVVLLNSRYKSRMWRSWKLWVVQAQWPEHWWLKPGVLGSFPWQQQRFFTFCLCFFLETFKLKRFNLGMSITVFC